MFSFNESLFSAEKEIDIPVDCDIIFVADMFSKDYVGGDELTTDALIDSSPLNVLRIHSKDLTLKTLEKGFQKYWIFGNFSNMDMGLIPSIVSNLKYSILEYDYKYCRYRSPEKHMFSENTPCDCHNQMHGKLISAFYHGSKSLWWMSENQMEKYPENMMKGMGYWSIVPSGSRIFDPLQVPGTLKSRGPAVVGASWMKFLSDFSAPFFSQ